MADKQVNLHPKNDTNTNLKPDIITANIPDKAVTLGKLDQNLQDTLNNFASSIAANRSDIDENTADIAINSTLINFAASIANNRTDIDKNRADINKNTVDIATNRTDIDKNTTEIGNLKASVNTGTFDPTSNDPAGQKSTAEVLVSKDEYYSTYALYRFAGSTFLHHYVFDGAIRNFLSATRIDGMFSNARFGWENTALTIPSFKNRITSAKYALSFAGDSHVVSVTFLDNSLEGNGLLYNASGLTSVVVADGAEVKLFSNCGYCFTECNSLAEIGAFDLSEATSLSQAFVHCSNLQHIHLKNIPVSFDISASTRFEEADLVEIIGNLVDLTGKTSQTLTMGATNLAKLTDSEKAVATNKNWILA